MRTHLAVALLSVVAVAALPAQTEDLQAPAATFPTEIEQVVVDVVVTDKKGQPISGLTLDDLIVTEDGQRQTVESFEAIELPVEPAPMAPAPPPISVNTTPEAQRGRTFVIVFDDTNITPFKARDAKAAVESFLVNGVREGDYVTLISTSGDAWWTTRMNAGREKLLEVIQRLDGRYIPDHSRERMTDWEAMRIHVYRDRNAAARVYQRFARYGIVQDRSGATDASPLSIQSDDPYVAARASEVYYDSVSRNRTTLNTLERALNALAGGQGRKSLILVSEGFIYDPELLEFKKVNDASRRANTAIYFVNASGLEGMSAELTSHYGPALPQQDMGFVFYELQESAAGPESLASDSGGFIVRNTNDLDSGIQRIADETRVYYLLGYTPTNRAHDGSFRKIEVKLRNGKGLEVRARKGYYAPSADGQTVAEVAPGVDPAFQAALDSPWAEDAIPLRMTHYVGAATGGKASVLVVTEVDIRELALQTVDDRSVGAIEFLLVITHRESGEFFRYDQKIDMNMLPATRERLSRRWYSIVRDAELLPGDHQAKIVVREASTGRVASVVHEFAVPPLEEFRVSTPILSDLFLPKAEGRGVTPQVLAHREFAQGTALMCQFDVFGAARDESGMPRVLQGYQVRRSDGVVYADVAETAIKPTSLGALTRVVAFPLQDASPGEYEIHLRFRDDLAGTDLELHEPFTVVAAPPADAPKTASETGVSRR